MTTTCIPADSELASQVRPYLTSQASKVHWRWFRDAVATLRDFETSLQRDWDSFSPSDRQFFRMLASGAVTAKPTFSERIERAFYDGKIVAGLLINREETLAYISAQSRAMDAIRLRVARDVWEEARKDADFERAASVGRKEIADGKSSVFFDPES